jgi:bloom syndrome protein
MIFPNQEHLILKYAEMMFMDFGKEFTSPKASGLMGKWSSSVVGWEVTVNAWRHINIAWKRKLCKGSLDLEIETEIMSPIHVLQAGHGAYTENHGYGISPDALNGISEDVIFLYCEASGLYQTRFKTVPGGLGLTYKQARMHYFDSLVKQGVVNLREKGQIQEPCNTTAGVTALDTQSAENQKTILSHLENMQKQLLSLQQDVNQLKHQDQILNPHTPPMNSTKSQTEDAMQVDCALSQKQPLKKIHLQDSLSTMEFNHLDLMSVSTPSTLFSSQHLSNKSSSSISQHPISVDTTPHHSQSTKSNQKDMLHYLQRLYGPEAQWKIQEQHDAIEALLKLQGDVVVALPTGIGKTAIAILPSFVESGYTIIILPLIALKEDWIRRLTELNIPFEHYDGSSGGHLKGHTNLILVSSDMAKFKHWEEALQDLHQRRPVIRQVVDEAHLYFTDSPFRPEAMGNPHNLRFLDAQMVLMSGTIPIKTEPFLVDAFVLQKHQVFRHHSARKELTYVLGKPERNIEDMINNFQHFLHKNQTETIWTDQDRYLIFTTFMDDGLKIAKKLGLEFYHADSEKYPVTDEERRARYTRWIDGHFKGLVASTALSAGNDYPHVRITAHLQSPFDMVTFIQQSSRAGRDGRKAHCLLITKTYPLNVKANEIDKKYGDLRGCKAMRSYAHPGSGISGPQTCLRYHITSENDAKGFSCYDFDEDFEVCSMCQKSKCRIIFQ